MSTTKKLSKGFALLIVLALVLAIMPFSAQATFTYNNFTKSPATEYTYHYVVGDTNQITLQVGPANDAWIFVGFDSQADAANTNVTWTIDSKLTKVSQAPVQLASGKWVNQVVLALAGSNWGYASVRAAWTGNPDCSYPMDFTINIDPKTVQTAKTGIVVDVYAKQLEIDEDTVIPAWHSKTASGITATVLSQSSETLPSDFTGIQNFSTPLAALIAMKGTPTPSTYTKVLSAVGYDVTGYVNSITAFIGRTGNVYLTQQRDADPVTYDGWRYCVYRNGEKVGACDYINASGFALQNNDVVVWRYDDYSYTFPTNYSDYTTP
ncbi:MAG: hypothetical protein IKO68_05310 [Oscillospiraceae bacterium]|nr:hypothetical protein [Oscillospiraceae bacterium]